MLYRFNLQTLFGNDFRKPYFQAGNPSRPSVHLTNLLAFGTTKFEAKFLILKAPGHQVGASNFFTLWQIVKEVTSPSC